MKSVPGSDARGVAREGCVLRTERFLISCVAGLLVLQSCAADPVIIPDVPALTWETGRCSQDIAALHAALSTMGCPLAYDELMVGSGAAFRTAWPPGRYHYGALVVAPEDLVINGAQFAGAAAERRTDDPPEQVWAAICDSIDEGRPVVLWHGWAAWVICGYEPEGQRLYIRRYESAQQGYEVMPFEPLIAVWPLGCPNGIVLLSYDRDVGIPDPDWPAILSRAIHCADWPPEERLHATYVWGLAGYDAWAETLRGGVDESGPQVDADFTWTLARTLAEARSCASIVLQQNAALHEAFEDAAADYMAQAQLLRTMQTVLAGGEEGDWMQLKLAREQHFPEQAVREQAAQLVERAKELEVMAVDALRVALADLGGTTDETGPQAREPRRIDPRRIRPDVPGAVSFMSNDERAAEHCQKGSRLKAQGRYAEAIKELQAALKADPKHVESHWVLAWLFIDMEDSEGAAREFRKVIELAPGSDKAREAQKALARLHQ